MEDFIALGIDLSMASKEMVEALLLEAADDTIFNDLLKANTKRPEILSILAEHPETPETVREEAAKILSVPVKTSTELVHAHGTYEMHKESTLQKVQQLSVPERRMLAMRGGHEVRSLLIKDSNKQVMMAVIENPKITESEVEMLANSRSVPDDVLREILKNREWMRKYSIIRAAVNNPKTPPGAAIPLLAGLRVRDLSLVENNRNISDAVRTAAKRLAQTRRAAG
jgi:hypothetical protein